MNEKYTTLEELVKQQYTQIYGDYKKYNDYDKYGEDKYDVTDYSELLRKFQEYKLKPEDPAITWRKALDNMPIGFIEKYLRKKKLANIKQEEDHE
jgi:hypothetical protein